MNKKIPTDGKPSASLNDAFGALRAADFPQAEPPRERRSADAKPSAPEKLGKVHLRLEKSGRAGKTVIVLDGPGIAALSADRREDLLKSLKRKFACGGADAENGAIELQGEDVARVRFFLQMLGYAC